MTTVQEHVWWCLNNHVADGYPPFGPCGCPTVTNDDTETPSENATQRQR